MQLAPESRVESKISSKNWRFDEIFSCAKLHFVLAESGRDLRVEALDQKGLTTKIHADCASERFVLKFQLLAGNRHDAPKGRNLIESLGVKAGCHLLLECAYEADKARALVLKQGLISVLTPKKNKNTPLVYNSEIYKRRNEVERFFFGSSVFAKFLLATTSLILFILAEP